MKKYKWYNRSHCPHIRLYGVHGDAINHTPGFRRLHCLQCGKYLDGPVRVADLRREEWFGLLREMRESEGREYA